MYVGPRQTNSEKEILSNEFGSERYARFVQSLGNLFRLRDCNPQRVYLGGGLETNGNDGEFTYEWHDESTQLIFHIATLMLNKESDPNYNSKKRHIGNDYVTIVYNDIGEDYKFGVMKGQFNYLNIVIKPLDYESNAVILQAKEDITEITLTLLGIRKSWILLHILLLCSLSVQSTRSRIQLQQHCPKITHPLTQKPCDPIHPKTSQ